MRRSVVSTLALLALATAAGAQPPQGPPAGGPPAQEQRPKNLKVLPADMPMRAVRDTMTAFTRALGVRCTYCHVGTEGQPLATYDFASDEKTAKQKAREMMRMAATINGEHLPRVPERRTPPIAVTCMTCHRGLAEPRPLQQVLLSAYETGGIDSTEARYRALRTQYFGRAAYDFGETTLAEVAAALRARNRLPDAVRLHLLNTQMTPTSGFAFRQAATAQLAAGDTAGARTSLEKALSLSPDDQQARRALDALRPRP
ncbi:MAG: c-type cytochrome [Gemmatirosa sp.]